jgi:hypothetical protein
MQAQAALAFAPEAIEIALAESRIDTLYYGLRRTLERALEGTVPSWLWTPGSFRDYPHRFIHPIINKISEIPPNIRYEPIWVYFFFSSFLPLVPLRSYILFLLHASTLLLLPLLLLPLLQFPLLLHCSSLRFLSLLS